MELNGITEKILKEITDWDGIFSGAYSLRENGECISFQNSDHIRIVKKEDKPGIDIYISEKASGETVYIPACVTKSDVKDLVYNDFHVQSGADVIIVAGCGVHTDGEEGSNHNGIHRFFLEAGSHAVYKEKHIGFGEGSGKRIIDPVTYAEIGDGAVLEMETLQLGGVDSTVRDTKAVLSKDAKLIIHESILTDGEETAETKFAVDLDGEDSSVDLVSRSVARGNSVQEYSSVINGKVRCTGHSECDAILSENGRVNAAPALNASSTDASLIHEAAIGKIAGEQIIKLMTLGLTEEEAEEKIIAGFLGA
ncbi:MAG: SufD family Fe-S cluster assembly protein [Lachnospiraceae bacterium]|nr:SufD family Fe-S cluster assembly protein [Lachnospiraceae bacterium]